MRHIIDSRVIAVTFDERVLAVIKWFGFGIVVDWVKVMAKCDIFVEQY